MDPQFATAVAPMAAAMASQPKPALGDIESRRTNIDTMFGALMGGVPDAPTVTTKIHTFKAADGHVLEIREYRSSTSTASGPTSAVFHTHGGGYVSGSAALFSRAVILRCGVTGVPFFSCSYRLAPEHPGTGPVEDCYAGLQWLYANAASLGIDPARIGVMGESAGGGLAAGLALMARDKELSPPLAKQILIYPMLDDRTTAIDASTEPYLFWNLVDNGTGWQALLGSKAAGKETVSPYVTPARAENLEGLPSTFIDVGTLDLFRDEDIAYAGRLVKEGVSTALHVYPGVPHGWEYVAPEANVTITAWQLRNAAILSF